VRIPAWTANPTRSALYRFADVVARGATLAVNNDLIVRGDQVATAGSAAGISREWRKGDVVALTLPMPIRRVLANDGVLEDRGRAAIQRGPIVYALEAVDNGGSLKDIRVPLDAPLTSTFRANLLNGVQAVTGKVGDRTINAVPYFAWNNRGRGEMEVWVPY
jgi:uncharacterized protein